MLKLNKEFVVGEEIETILEEMSEREEFQCTAYAVCAVHGCNIDAAIRR